MCSHYPGPVGGDNLLCLIFTVTASPFGTIKFSLATAVAATKVADSQVDIGVTHGIAQTGVFRSGRESVYNRLVLLERR